MNTPSPLHIDLSSLSTCCQGHAVEWLAKALSTDRHDIWKPHENPFISQLIELFTDRGLTRIAKVKEELDAWVQGYRRRPSSKRPTIMPRMMPQWTKDEMGLVRIYLESLPPQAFTLQDWDYLVSYLLQRYLPYQAIRSEADWLAARSTMLGKANAAGIAAKAAIAATNAVMTWRNLPYDFPKATKLAAEYASLHAAENVVSLTDTARASLAKTLIDHMHKQQQGEPAGELQQELFDTFDSWNRDWRRIALTESGDAFGQGFIASLEPGTQVKRIEMYDGACPFCKSIDGKVLTVVPPGKEEKNWDTEVWVGKNNIGRSASKNKITPEGLVPRTDSELWKIPAGTVHPHCRGGWIAL